jgi:peroxin-1
LETKRDEVNLIPPTVLRSISSELFKDQLSTWVSEVPDSVAFINPRSVYSVNQLAELDFDYTKLITLGKLTLMGRLSEVQSSIESAKKANNTNSGNQKNSGPNDSSKSPFSCPSSGIVTIVWTNIAPVQHVVIKDTLLSTLGGDLYSLFQLSSPISAHMELKSLTVRPIFIGTPDQTQLTQNNTGQTWISELVSSWIQDNLAKLKTLNLLQLNLNHGMVIPLTNPSSSVMKQNITYAYLDFSILDHFIKGNFDPPYTSIDRLSFKNISIQEGPPLFTNELPIHPPTLINSISTSLAPLGAVDTVINNSISCLKVGLSGEFIKQKLKVWPHASMLLCGGKGSGKTSVAQAILKSLATDPQVLAYPITLSCETLVNDRVSKIQEKFSELVLKAAFNQPSIIFLDNLDSLIPIEMEHMDSFRYRQLAEVFIDTFKRSLAKYPRISVLATGSQSQSIHPLLLSSHIFTHTFHITPPGKPERETIINTLLSNSTVLALKNSVAHLDLSWIAGQTEGYLPTDLKSLIERALHQAAIRTIQTSKKSQLEVNQEDFRLAQEGFIPVALRGIKLQTSGVAWGDIGGLKETKAVLRETLEWPIKYSVIFKTCPLRLRSGLLLYGYPGCGKTMLASAVAKECGLNFISVKGPELLSKYIGASEKSTRDLFERASAAKPCVLFFDEFEAIAPRRGHDSTGVTDRVVNQLLTQMDGAEGLEGVYVLAATSRPDLIDPALLRPGRLDKSLICDLPSHEDRVDILKAHAAHFHLNDDVDLNWVADECEDFTGADLQAILYNAHLHAIHQNIDSKMEELSESESKSNGVQENVKVDFSIFNSDTTKNSVVPLTMSKAERDSVERRLNKIKLNKAQSGNNSSQKLNNGGAAQDQKAKSKESPKVSY